MSERPWSGSPQPKSELWVDIDGDTVAPGVVILDPATGTPESGASGATPLTGTAVATSVVGPFTPTQRNRPINLLLTGTWVGNVAVKRSIDAGVTKNALTAGGTQWATFNANCNEPVWEETEGGATFYLDITLSSGSVTYRMAQ